MNATTLADIEAAVVRGNGTAALDG